MKREIKAVLKGTSLKVHLDDSQVEQIASLTADKVNEAKSYMIREDDFYKSEIDSLNNKIKRLEEIILSKTYREELLRKRLDEYKAESDRLKKMVNESSDDDDYQEKS